MDKRQSQGEITVKGEVKVHSSRGRVNVRVRIRAGLWL